MSGPGGFRVGQACDGPVSEVGTGGYSATGLGHGQYSFDVCITTFPVVTFAGSVTFTTSNGATLGGTISGTFTGGIGPSFNVTVTVGTKRFRRTGGDLVIGPLVESNFINCQHMICLDWTDTGPISGTLRHISRR